LIAKLKGAYIMKQKKFTSWGVSFASLALVAGMMSYMGITNKDKTSQTNTVAQAQTATQTSTQASQSVNNQNSTISYEIPNQTANKNASQTSTNQTSSSGQHGNFDTTTGGT
jgi:hypothetical protein